jgi:hypothetical protein
MRLFALWRGIMKRAVLVALGTVTFISGAAAINIGASATPEVSLTRAQYDAALEEIAATRPLVQARCDEEAGTGTELCRAQAEADEMLRSAEIEARFRRDQASARGAQFARIEARYQVERTKCAAMGGNNRDRCLVAAHATRGRALLEIAAPYQERS